MVNGLYRKVLEYIEAHRQELVGLLQTMARTVSVNPAFDPSSPGEGPMADLVAARYTRLGIPVERVEAVAGRPNIIARWAGTVGRPRLLVNCHLDTVGVDLGPWADPYTGKVTTGWTVDPFGGVIKDGWIYGRGAADHKSPIAALLMAIEALRAGGVRLKGDLTCIHDADEETGERYGLRYLARHMSFEFDMALYACTTGFTPLARTFFTAMGEHNVIRTPAGWQTYRVTVRGHNYHNMTPRRGYGAAEAALILLERLRPLMERVNAYLDPVEGGGHPAMRVSSIECGPRASEHHQALSCTVVINRRIHQSVGPAAARAELERVIAEYNAEFPENEATPEVVRDLPPFVTPADHPVVAGLCRAVELVTGQSPTVAGLPCPVGISAFFAEHPIPMVMFGYGIVNLHHAHYEHIAIDDLERTAKVYAIALMEWLGVAAETRGL